MGLQQSGVVSGLGLGLGGSIVYGVGVWVRFVVVLYGCKFGIVALWLGFAGFLGG